MKTWFRYSFGNSGNQQRLVTGLDTAPTGKQSAVVPPNCGRVVRCRYVARSGQSYPRVSGRPEEQTQASGLSHDGHCLRQRRRVCIFLAWPQERTTRHASGRCVVGNMAGDQIEVFIILNGYENIDRNIFSRSRKREGLEDVELY